MRKRHKKKNDEWREAKRRCRLSDEEVRMARELGFEPGGLVKNIPAKSQPWKVPVGQWIRDLHVKRFGEARGSRHDREDAPGYGRNLEWLCPSRSGRPASAMGPR